MNSDARTNSSRLAKNTAFLYLRMLINLSIGLFTSRIVLHALGIDDYGVYNVVGGAVAMLSIFTTSLSTAISRYLTFNLGVGDYALLKETFSVSVTIQAALSAAVIILGIPLGLWFTAACLNIPAGSEDAAQWVLAFSVLTFAVNLITVPYNASIIAHERMVIFARISILEVVLKLGVAYSLYLSLHSRLILYAVLQFVVALIIRVCYSVYCGRHFPECKFKLSWRKGVVKDMCGFAGWNLFGTTAGILNTQGVNIISNIFFGVAVNAARGITQQVQSLIMQFAYNFTTALNPQITKAYANQDRSYLFNLIIKGSKMSFFLMFIMALPIMFEMEFLLKIWLGDYPEYTTIFARLALIGSMVDFLGNSTANAVWATGKVRKYYLFTTPVSIFVLPISYVVFYFGGQPWLAYVVFICIYALLVPIRLWILKSLIPQFKPSAYYSQVLGRIILMLVPSVGIPYLANLLMGDFGLRSVVMIAITLVATAASIYLIGFDRSDRKMCDEKICAVIAKIKRK